MVNRYWLLVNRYWSIGNGQSLLVNRQSLLVNSQWSIGGGVGSGRIESFRDLEAWKESRVLRQTAYRLARRLPKEERSLQEQIKRSAVSVTANIAEGFGRFHYQENIQFCRQSRGSACELLDHTITMLDEGLVSAAEYKEFEAQVERVLKLLNGYIRMLADSKKNSKFRLTNDQ
ncbi:MAG: four helix bundle protein [Nitrospirota bacterium]